MTRLTRPPCPFVPAVGRFTAKSTPLVAREFRSAAARVSVSPFVVISCVAEGSAGTPLCFTGPELALAGITRFFPAHLTN